jgi:hypothetical protein
MVDKLWLSRELLSVFTQTKHKTTSFIMVGNYTAHSIMLVFIIEKPNIKGLVKTLIILTNKIAYQSLRNVGQNIKSLVAMPCKPLLNEWILLSKDSLNLNQVIPSLKHPEIIEKIGSKTSPFKAKSFWSGA